MKHPVKLVFLVFLLHGTLQAGFFDFFTSKKETVSLVLGSGGARGYAHIGVIRELENRGLKIKAVAGSSMGALIGGLYAAGKLDAYEKWILTLGVPDILDLVSFMPDRAGLVDADKVYAKIYELIGDVRIEELPVKFVAVATDITDQQEVRFTSGPLIDAIKASTAIPSVFPPVELDGHLLVDGGVLNPIPTVALAKEDNDLTVVVDVGARIPNRYHISIPKAMQVDNESIYTTFLNLFKSDEKKEDDTGIFHVVRKTLDTVQWNLSLYLKEKYKADIYVDISYDSCDFYEFHRAYEMVQIGRLATRSALKAYDER